MSQNKSSFPKQERCRWAKQEPESRATVDFDTTGHSPSDAHLHVFGQIPIPLTSITSIYWLLTVGYVKVCVSKRLPGSTLFDAAAYLTDGVRQLCQASRNTACSSTRIRTNNETNESCIVALLKDP
jgi:hypothetical protein